MQKADDSHKIISFFYLQRPPKSIFKHQLINAYKTVFR